MKKKSLTFLLMSFLALSVGFNISNDLHENNVVNAEEPFQIKSIEDFKTVFDGKGTFCNRDIELLTDLDVSNVRGVAKVEQSGMADTYIGTFNGNGHILSGIGAAESVWNANIGGLFHLIGAQGVVKNLVVDWTATRDNIGSIAYNNQGTFENVTVITHVPGSPNSFGAFVAQDNGGFYKNCNSHFIITGGMGGGVHPISFGGNVDASHVSNCNFSRYTSGAGDTSAAITDTQHFDTIDEKQIYQSTTKSLSVGESFDLNEISYGIPGTWESDQPIVSINNNIVEATGSGVATITGTMNSSYPYTNKTATIEVTISAAANVSNISINESDVSVAQTKTTTLTATLTGNLYESIEWKSLDQEKADVMKSPDNDLSATVTGKNVGDARIQVSVVSQDGKNYTDEITINVTEYSVIKNKIPVDNSKFMPKWEGAGIMGLYFNNDAIEGDMTKYQVESTSSLLKDAVRKNWEEQLYISFSGAPDDNSGIHSVTITLSLDMGDKMYIYESTYWFNGKKFVNYKDGVIKGNDAIGIDQTQEYTYEYENDINKAEFNWTVADDGKLQIVGDSNTKVVQIKGLVSGDSSLSCHINFEGEEYILTMSIKVVAQVKDVTSIKLDKENISIKEGQSSSVNVEFTEGTEYNEITWKTESDQVATVEGNDKSATVFAQGIGNTTLTVTVKTNSGEVTESINIDVEEATKFNIYFLINEEELSRRFSGVGYGLFFGDNKFNNEAVELIDTNIDISSTYKTTEEAEITYVGSLYKATIFSELIVANQEGTGYLQLCSKSNNGSRWGKPYYEVNDIFKNNSGVILTLEKWGSGDSNVKVIGTEKDGNDIVNLYDGVRDQENSICHLLSDTDKLNEKLTIYDNLSEEAKTLANNIIENVDGGTVTFEQTIEYLRSVKDLDKTNAVSENANTISELLTAKDSSSINIILTLAIVMVIMISGYYLVIRKRENY